MSHKSWVDSKRKFLEKIGQKGQQEKETEELLSNRNLHNFPLQVTVNATELELHLPFQILRVAYLNITERGFRSLNFECSWSPRSILIYSYWLRSRHESYHSVHQIIAFDSDCGPRLNKNKIQIKFYSSPNMTWPAVYFLYTCSPLSESVATLAPPLASVK